MGHCLYIRLEDGRYNNKRVYKYKFKTKPFRSSLFWYLLLFSRRKFVSKGPPKDTETICDPIATFFSDSAKRIPYFETPCIEMKDATLRFRAGPVGIKPEGRIQFDAVSNGRWWWE